MKETDKKEEISEEKEIRETTSRLIPAMELLPRYGSKNEDLTSGDPIASIYSKFDIVTSKFEGLENQLIEDTRKKMESYTKLIRETNANLTESRQFLKNLTEKRIEEIEKSSLHFFVIFFPFGIFEIIFNCQKRKRELRRKLMYGKLRNLLRFMKKLKNWRRLWKNYSKVWIF